MQTKTVIIFSAVLTALGGFMFEFLVEDPDLDDPVLMGVIERLADEGYEVLNVESTWLGRYRIEAHSDEFEREIVVAPGAGTRLRDEKKPLTESDADGDE